MVLDEVSTFANIHLLGDLEDYLCGVSHYRVLVADSVIPCEDVNLIVGQNKVIIAFLTVIWIPD